MNYDSRPEDELTYTHAAADLSRILQTIWPDSDIINVDGRAARLVKSGLRRSVHFISRDPITGERDRVQLLVRNKELLGIRDNKYWKGSRKFESAPIRAVRPTQIQSLLDGFGPITASFSKERLVLVYELFLQGRRQISKAKLKIGLDRMVSFSPEDPGRHGECKHYVEFEGDGSGVEVVVTESGFFREKISQFVTPITTATAKWNVASAFCKSPFELDPSREAVLSIVTAGLALLVRPGGHYLEDAGF